MFLGLLIQVISFGYSTVYTPRDNLNFDICYINMEADVKRKDHVSLLLSTVCNNYYRFNAVDGSALYQGTKTIEDYARESGASTNINFHSFSMMSSESMGMVGCKLSHYLNLRRIEKLNTKKPILICEDDIDFECNFIETIEDCLKALPNDWDILLITENYWEDQNSDPKLNRKLAKVTKFFECLGYIVNQSKAAKKIADLIEYGCHPYVPVDLFLGEKANEKHLTVYAIRSRVAIQLRNVFGSSIPTSQAFFVQPLKNSLSKRIHMRN